MGWYDGHMHEFEIQGQSYGQPMPELDDLDIISERTVRLNQVVTGEKFKFDYMYDMGDGWDHQILVEKKCCRLIQRSAIPSASKANGPAHQRIVAVSGAMEISLR